MQVGDVVRVALDSTYCTLPNVRPKTSARVVYVHPAGRYVTVEVTGPSGKFRESVWPEEIRK